MAGLNVDSRKYVKRIPWHVTALPPESAVPIDHYKRSAINVYNLLVYTERSLRESSSEVARDRHFGHLSTMVLLSLVEAFERFLKELAAACIDHVGKYVLDDRLDVFSTKGNAIAAHFSSGSFGKALCEGITWCDCEQTNKRFRRVLADPFEEGNFYVFPVKTQQPSALQNRYDVMSIVWQLRHTIAHNMGVVTSSDALKFRLLTKSEVSAPCLLWPTKGDVWYLKLFLDETADLINREVGLRLATLLTTLHQQDPTLFDAGLKAQDLANLFGNPCAVGGQTRAPLS